MHSLQAWELAVCAIDFVAAWGSRSDCSVSLVHPTNSPYPVWQNPQILAPTQLIRAGLQEFEVPNIMGAEVCDYTVYSDLGFVSGEDEFSVPAQSVGSFELTLKVRPNTTNIMHSSCEGTCSRTSKYVSVCLCVVCPDVLSWSSLLCDVLEFEMGFG